MAQGRRTPPRLPLTGDAQTGGPARRDSRCRPPEVYNSSLCPRTAREPGLDKIVKAPALEMEISIHRNSTLSLSAQSKPLRCAPQPQRSEEHTSELQSRS